MDHCCVVYHSFLTDAQDKELDRLQAHALRYIYGKDLSYSCMRRLAGVTTLRERRVELCDKFAGKCLKNTDFEHWFPARVGRRSARSNNSEKYEEKFARCDHLKNYPLFFKRRRLNGKVGKKYRKWHEDRRSGGPSRDERVYESH